MNEITVLIVGVVAILLFVRFWRYILSAAILVAAIYICAMLFAGVDMSQFIH